MTSIIEKRVSLHRELAAQRQQNNALRSQLGQSQGLANIGSVTCMIAHEINNLLTPLSNYAALALANPDDDALVKKALQKTVQNGERAAKIMESMLAIANGNSQEKTKSKLIELVEDVFRCLCRDFSKDNIHVKIEIPEKLTVWAVGVQIQQVLMNLVLNAREAMAGHGGVLTIRASETGDAVRIEVCDTGCGIEEANMELVFEPFFSTKNAEDSRSGRSGRGLGLAFCREVIELHGGSIGVESKAGGGTAFKIALPRS